MPKDTTRFGFLITGEEIVMPRVLMSELLNIAPTMMIAMMPTGKILYKSTTCL